MSQLGNYLKQLRQQKDRSRRWVEKQSKVLYPEEKGRQISHSYLRQIEEGLRPRPNPLKLRTLAEIYNTDCRQLLAVAGYMDADGGGLSELMELPGNGDADIRSCGQEMGSLIKGVEQTGEVPTKLEKAQQMIAWLERHGIHAEYLMNSMMGLSEESLHLISRLITTLSIQERQLRKGQAPILSEKSTVESGVKQ